jgi:hypothetical protein
MKPLKVAGGAVVAVLTGVVSVIAVVAFLGLVAPYVHKICIVEHNGRPSIDAHWGFYLSSGLPNPAPDSEGCIRNTPTREALSALGIWKLGSPEEQIVDHLNH